MNKTNKYLNYGFRAAIIITFIMVIASWTSFINGLKNIDVNGLSEDNIVERFLAIVNDLTGSFKLYIVVMILLFVCLVLSILTRYKASIVSLIFRSLSLLTCAMLYVGGVGIATAFSTLGNYSNLNIVAHDKASLIASLEANNVSAADVTAIADAISDKDTVASMLAAYMFTPIILFILIITTIHCLVKRKKEANPDEQSSENY